MKISFLLIGMFCLIVGCSTVITDPKQEIFSKAEISFRSDSTFMKTVNKLSEREKEQVLDFVMQPRSQEEKDNLYPISIKAILDLHSAQELLEAAKDTNYLQLAQEIQTRKIAIDHMDSVVDRQRAQQQLVPYEDYVQKSKEEAEEENYDPALEAVRAAEEADAIIDAAFDNTDSP